MEYKFEDGIDHLLFSDPSPEDYGLDPKEIDKEEWAKAVKIGRELAYAVAEGIVDLEEGADGEIRFFPAP